MNAMLKFNEENLDFKPHFILQIQDTALTFDNVQIKKEGHLQSREVGDDPNFRLWAMSFAVKNRVDFSDKPDGPNTRTSAAAVPPEKLLPSFEDFSDPQI